MQTKVARMAFQPFCLELGRHLRKASGNPRDWEWERALIGRANREFGVVSEDHGYIRARDVRIGMRGCAVLASLGQPSSVHTTTTARGERHQLAFDRPVRRFVYLDQDRVEGFQTLN